MHEQHAPNLFIINYIINFVMLLLYTTIVDFKLTKMWLKCRLSAFILKLFVLWLVNKTPLWAVTSRSLDTTYKCCISSCEILCSVFTAVASSCCLFLSVLYLIT